MTKVTAAEKDNTILIMEEDINFVQGILPERHYRLFLGHKAEQIGVGGISQVAKASGASRTTVRRGRDEIRALRQEGLEPDKKQRKEGGGRKRDEVRDPRLVAAVQALLEEETAGNPMGGKLYTSLSQRKIKKYLWEFFGIKAGLKAIDRIMKHLGYSRQKNRKLLAVGKQHPDRDKQFRRIAAVRRYAAILNVPILSVDTKKKEKLGEYAADGTEYRAKKHPREVLDHDFEGEQGTAVPYGLYDLQRNEGYVALGFSKDTALFAVNAIEQWWNRHGKNHYSNTNELYLLCDGGGSNSSRAHLWKLALALLAERIGIKIRVLHYPPYCSKYNPVEHRLFSIVSMSWAGKPKKDRETIKKYIESTTTTTGLKVYCWFDEEEYQTKIKVPDEEYAAIDIVRDDKLPQWVYCIFGLKKGYSVEDIKCVA